MENLDFSRLDPDEVLAAAEDQMLGETDSGFCLACGIQVMNIEPDARGYECESCGATAVYGATELLIMGAAG